MEHAVAAPLCTKQLADLGADVIKVERPGLGDMARHYDNLVHSESTHFTWLNRGKRSVAIDLRKPDGQSILDKLLASADVMVTNLSASAVRRFLNDPKLVSRNRSLIRCYINGYGFEGPYEDRPAYDLLVQGEAGVTAATGTPEQPAKCGVSVADLASGCYAFGAIAAALFERSRDGRGRRIDISLFDAATEWMMPLLLASQFSGEDPKPRGLHHATIAPYGAYRTKDDVLLNIAAHNEEQWLRLCDVLGVPLRTSDSLRTARGRYAQRQLVDSAIAEAVSRKTERELAESLTAADVPWGLVREPSDVLTHPQLLGSARWSESQLPSGTKVKMLGGPIRFDGRFSGSGRVPGLGEHTSGVLEALGYDEAAIRQLQAARVIQLTARDESSSVPRSS